MCLSLSVSLCLSVSVSVSMSEAAEKDVSGKDLKKAVYKVTMMIRPDVPHKSKA